jgi:hypothetical protein
MGDKYGRLDAWAEPPPGRSQRDVANHNLLPCFHICLLLLPCPPTGSLLSHALVSLPPLTRWHPTQNSSTCGAQKCTTLLDSHICAPTLLIPGTRHEGTGTMTAKLNDRWLVLEEMYCPDSWPCCRGVLGAQKGASSFLFHTINKHPQVLQVPTQNGSHGQFDLLLYYTWIELTCLTFVPATGG